MSWLINYVASPTVFGILKGALDNFIDGIDSDKFEMDFHSGTIDLADLKVKPNFIHDLGLLPKGCKLAHSHIGTLHATVTSYTSKEPIIVQISDVDLVFINDTVVDETTYNEEEEQNRNPFAAFAAATDSAWDLKKRGVDVAWSAFEFASHEEAASADNETKEMTMKVDRGVWKNLDNLQIEIRNIHIRFEDTITMKTTTGTASPFAGGMYLKTIALFSTDAQGQPMYVKDSDAKGFYHKTMVMSGVGGYWSASEMKQDDVIAHEKKGGKAWRRRMHQVLKSLEQLGSGGGGGGSGGGGGGSGGSGDGSGSGKSNKRKDQVNCPYRHVVAPCTIRCQTVEAHGYDDQTEMPRWDVQLTMDSCHLWYVTRVCSWLHHCCDWQWLAMTDNDNDVLLLLLLLLLLLANAL
jgi:uncharacterized membrane protein YgcG